eukprot:5709666-Amphidinium_carterae.1
MMKWAPSSVTAELQAATDALQRVAKGEVLWTACSLTAWLQKVYIQLQHFAKIANPKFVKKDPEPKSETHADAVPEWLSGKDALVVMIKEHKRESNLKLEALSSC